MKETERSETMSEKKWADALLQQCYADYRVKLFNYCLSRLYGSREAADDCVQETFIVFYDKLLGGESFENPRAFLYRTADNFVKRQKQSAASDARRRVPLEDAWNVSSENSDYNEKIAEIDYDKCAEKLISLLSDEEKELYELRYIQKVSVESMAEMLGLSRPAASMRLLRLRNKIKDMVYGYNIEEKGG